MAVASSQSARSSSSSNAATPAALYDLALGLPKVVQIRPETRRKAGRGYGLLGVTDVPQPVQAGPVTLDPATTVEAALQCFGQPSLAQRTCRAGG
jgi:inorganic triphosphatase YgiF